MCLVIPKSNSIETAKKDITCYKKIKEGLGNLWRGIVYTKREYPFNTLLTAEYKTNKYIDLFEKIDHLEVKSYVINAHIEHFIEEGFHALKYKPVLFKEFNYRYCVIPKGTEICYGINNDIVAVNMIVFRTKLDYIKYKLKSIFKAK